MKFFISVMLCALTLSAAAQFTDSAYFPMNEYLYTTRCFPYPRLRISLINQVDTTGFKNVMNYGAAGNGVALDDDELEDAILAAKSGPKNAAGYKGVILPAGRTFMVSKLTTINMSATDTIWVYAYGARMKMANMKKNSALFFQFPDGTQTGRLFWLGGTFDGNKDNQPWPGNPKGGQYDDSLSEDHGRFVGAGNAESAIFYRVHVMNMVMDGIGIVNSRIAVVANSLYDSAAPIQYADVQDQGTGFKVRGTDPDGDGQANSKAFYLDSDTCNGGSIGVHYSTPNNTTPDSSVTTVTRCQFHNQYQNCQHFEDCRKNFQYKNRISGDTTEAFEHRLHVSNETYTFSMRNCSLKNIGINFNQASHLKVASIDSCTFTTETKSLAASIDGRATIVTRAIFDGECADQQISSKYVYRSRFRNFGAHKAITTVITAANNTFENGTVIPISFFNLGVGYNNAYINCPSNTNSTPANNSYLNNFKTVITLFNHSRKFMGRLTTGN